MRGGGGGGGGGRCNISSVDSVPPVVAAVEQGIDQAEAEVKREKLAEEKKDLVKDFGEFSGGSLCKKPRLSGTLENKKKRCRKQRLLPKDIFS